MATEKTAAQIKAELKAVAETATANLKQFMVAEGKKALAQVVELMLEHDLGFSTVEQAFNKAFAGKSSTKTSKVEKPADAIVIWKTKDGSFEHWVGKTYPARGRKNNVFTMKATQAEKLIVPGHEKLGMEFVHSGIFGQTPVATKKVAVQKIAAKKVAAKKK